MTMLLHNKTTTSGPSRCGPEVTSYKLAGKVRESDIFWWPDQPLRLDVSRVQEFVGRSAEKIIEAAGNVVVEVFAEPGSPGSLALSAFPEGRLRNLGQEGLFEVLP